MSWPVNTFPGCDRFQYREPAEQDVESGCCPECGSDKVESVEDRDDVNRACWSCVAQWRERS